MAFSKKFLTKKSIVAGLWLLGYRVLARFAGLLKTPIIARILTPSQFGVFGVVSIALNLFETFSETGLEQALIQQKKISNVALSSAWILTLLRGVVISIILMLTAPIVAYFFSSPETITMIQFIALTPILRSLRNPNLVLYKRQIQFQRETIMLMVGTLTEVISAVLLVVLLRSEWGLVYSILIGAVGELLVSYLLFEWPRLEKPSLTEIRHLLGFGRWIWSSSILSYLANQGDDIVVGSLLGTSALGFYQNAYKLASLPSTQITGTITQVTFPALSSLQSDPDRLRRAFIKSWGVNALFTIPISIILFLFADPLVRVIYGVTWLPMVPALKILSIFGLIRSFNSVLGPLAVGIGKPRLITYNGIVQIMVLFGLIYPFSQWFGINGAAWASVFAIIAADMYLVFNLRTTIFRLK